YSLSVTAADALGNTSGATVVSYVLDTTPPVPPSVTPPASPGNSTSPVFVISAPGSASTSCSLVDPNGVTVFSGACPGTGRFDVSAGPDGTYTLTVTGTDVA